MTHGACVCSRMEIVVNLSPFLRYPDVSGLRGFEGVRPKNQMPGRNEVDDDRIVAASGKFASGRMLKTTVPCAVCGTVPHFPQRHSTNT